MPPMKAFHLMMVLLMLCVVEHRATQACYQTSPRAECNELSLTKVPANLNPSIISLDLSKNPIRQLGPTDFRPYKELETLLLSDCELKQLSEVIFSGLRKLRMIDLARNKLASIPSNIFHNNMLLNHVVFDENGPFKLHFPILKSDSVEILSISACGIEYIYEETFSGMPNLKILDLTRNLLQRVSPNAFRNNILKRLWIDSVRCLNQVAHKLCSDKVVVTTEDDSMFDQLCLWQIRKDSGTLETNVSIQTDTIHSLTVETATLELSSEKFTDNGLSPSDVLSSTYTSVSNTPSSKIFHETISKVDTKRTTDSLPKVTNLTVTPFSEKDTDHGFKHSETVINTSLSLSVIPSSSTVFHDTNFTTETRKTTDSWPKETALSPADDDGIRLRIGKTEVWVISGLIIIGLVIYFTYRYMRKIRKGRLNEFPPDHVYEYVPPLYRRQCIKFGYVPELVYDSLPQNDGYEIPTFPPLPPRPPTLRT